MRSCDEVLELISAALDGQLTGDEQAALDEHLSHCSACSALFAELKSLQAAAAELEEVPAPDGFAGRVMDAIAAAPAQEQSDNVVPFPTKKRSRTHWKGWAATAAAVVIVVLGAVALPGQLGVGTNTASTADCAAPAQAENASAALSEEGEAVEAESFSMTASDDNGASRVGTGDAAAEPESAVGGQFAETDGSTDEINGDAETQEMPVTVKAASQSSPAVFCGVLTLTGESLPEGLENYEYTEDEEGKRTYVVPAEFFFAYLKALEERQSSRFTCNLDQEGAEYGLIIVSVPD